MEMRNTGETMFADKIFERKKETLEKRCLHRAK